MSLSLLGWLLMVISLSGGVAIFFYWKSKFTKAEAENKILRLENSELEAKYNNAIEQLKQKPDNHSPINDILDKL